MAHLFRRSLLLTSSLAVLAACSTDPGKAPPDNEPGEFVAQPTQPTHGDWGQLFGSGQAEFHLQSVVSGVDGGGVPEYRVNGAGYITAVDFFTTNAVTSPITCSDVTISFGPTTLSSLTTTFASNVNEGRGSLVTALSHKTITIPVVAADGAFTVPLDTPYYYDGSDNLVLDVVRAGTCSAFHVVKYDNRNPQTTVYAFSAAAATGLTRQSPAMRFHFRGGEAKRVKPSSGATCAPFYNDSRTQMLFQASDIAGSGPITGLGFQLYSPTVATTIATTVKMAHTDATALTTTFSANVKEAFTTVADHVTFVVPASMPADGWFWVPLNGAFHYDGVRNVVVQFQTAAATPNCNPWVLTSSAPSSRAHNLGGGPDAVFADGVDDFLYKFAFRFRGAPLAVPAMSGGTGVVLGWTTGGQWMSLYDSVRLGTGGRITRIAVRLYDTPAATTVPNMKIYMGTTVDSQYTPGAPYANGLTGATLVYSGALAVPGGMRAGDWLEIPLQTAFVYDPTKNLSVLFTSDAAPANNWVALTSGASFASVHRLDNTVDLTGNPTSTFPGIASLRYWLDP